VWLQFSLDVTEAKNKAKANRAASQQRLREFTFNLDTGVVSQRVVSNVFGDFPSIPRHLAGQSISCLHCIWPSFCFGACHALYISLVSWIVNKVVAWCMLARKQSSKMLKYAAVSLPACIHILSASVFFPY